MWGAEQRGTQECRGGTVFSSPPTVTNLCCASRSDPTKGGQPRRKRTQAQTGQGRASTLNHKPCKQRSKNQTYGGHRGRWPRSCSSSTGGLRCVRCHPALDTTPRLNLGDCMGPITCRRMALREARWPGVFARPCTTRSVVTKPLEWVPGVLWARPYTRVTISRYRNPWPSWLRALYAAIRSRKKPECSWVGEGTSSTLDTNRMYGVP